MEASAVQLGHAAVRAPATPGVLLRLRSDEQLLTLFRAGNEDAFQVLHDRYRPRLLAYVRQMLPVGVRGDAEDALQDVFIRAYGALRADERPVAVRAWLYRVAHNRCIDTLRRPAPTPVERSERQCDDRHDPCDEAERREALGQLVSDLQRLPEAQRSCLLLREFEGLSYAELGVVLAASQPAVKSLLVRARMGLADAAEARGTDCEQIRVDLACACERGVRMNARTRLHLRDCDRCTAYHAALRATQKQVAGLAAPAGPLATLLKLAGLGGGSAAASSGALTGGTSGGAIAGLAGGGSIAAKLAVVVCCVAVTTGGAVRAVDPQHRPAPGAPAAARPATAVASAAAAPAWLRRGAIAPGAKRRADVARTATPVPAAAPAVAPAAASPPAPVAATPAPDAAEPTGGLSAPDEAPAPDDPIATAGDVAQPADPAVALDPPVVSPGDLSTGATVQTPAGPTPVPTTATTGAAAAPAH